MQNSMYGRGGASSLGLGGLGRGGVADNRITVYGFCSNCGADLISLPQAERKRSEYRASPTGLAGKRKLTVSSSLLGYFSGLAKVADQPTSDP